MKTQLKDSIDSATCHLFHFLQGIDVPGIEDEGLLTDRVSPHAQGKADMGVVQIVGRADRDVINALSFALAPQFFNVPVESLEFRKEVGIGKIAIQDTYGIRAIQCSDQDIAGIVDRLEMAGGDVTGYSRQGKSFHLNSLFSALP